LQDTVKHFGIGSKQEISADNYELVKNAPGELQKKEGV